MEEVQSAVVIARDLIEDIISSIGSLDDLIIQLMLEVERDGEGEAMEDLAALLDLKRLVEVEDEMTLSESVLIIYEQIVTGKVLRPYQQHFTTESGCNRVSWSNLDEKWSGPLFKSTFRFERADLPILIKALQIPEKLSFDGYHTTDVEAVVFMLRRLSGKIRYSDVTMEFDRLPQFLSQIFNGTCVFIFSKIEKHIRRINHGFLMDRHKLETWARALEEKGCPLPNSMGYGDGTHVGVAKPKRGQRSWYCGLHKTHCFKIQGVIVPSGIMMAWGPFDGPTHDSAATDIIGMDDLLVEHFTLPDGTGYNVFWDPAYRMGDAMITQFRQRRDITDEELEWNRRMCRLRISVEWGFAKIKNLFHMLDDKNNLKTLMSPVAVYFFVALHLTNIHTTLYGSQVATYFGVETDSLLDYLAEFKD